jgi:hypothetical protein
MVHRAALYTVKVRPKRRTDDFRLLGDIDDHGTDLLDVLAGMMGDFTSTSLDGTRVVVCEAHDLISDTELFLQLQHGETNIAADIMSSTGERLFRQFLDHTHAVRSGALFQFPEGQRLGWLAVHVHGRRGVKGLLASRIIERFRQQFDDLLLFIEPYVSESVLLQAIDDDRIDRVRLIKYKRPNDPAFAEASKWFRGNQEGAIELVFYARQREQRLLPGLIREFFGSRGEGEQDAYDDAYDEIIEFQGLRFEEVKVEVVLPNGQRRTFNIETPDSGHPFTLDLPDLPIGDDEDPTREGLIDALRDALQEVQ